jgi:Flp pilus assembly pilin Flp
MLNDLLLHALAAGQTLRVRTQDDSGQTLAEYGLIITVIAVGLVLLAMMVFRDALAGAFNAATGCLDSVC